MNRARRALTFGVLGALLLLSAQTALAGPVTVVNTGTAPGVTLTVNLPWVPYNGGALVGVENLTVDGVPYDAFCIDLYHFATVGGPGLEYNIVPLSSAPGAIPPGPMGWEKATFISEMWAYGYNNALTSNNAAAGFQLAIWGVLQGTISGGVVTPTWTWLNNGATTAAAYGATSLITWTNDNDGKLVQVLGLNHVDGSAQSYAIPGVPDGGTTILLLGSALLGLGALRRKFRG